MGDHGYARRQPPVDSEEDGVQRAEEERPCSLCQHYKTKLEQQQQHTVRLQREVIFILKYRKNISDWINWYQFVISFFYIGRGDEETSLQTE